MYQGIIHFHATWRYVVLLLLLFTIGKALIGWVGNKEHTTGDAKLALFAMIALHLQLLTGLILYTLSPAVHFGSVSEIMKMPNLFWTVEHIGAMIVAVVIISIGKKIALKARDDQGKHKRIVLYFLVGLIIIFISIPWPWGRVSRDYLPF